VKALNVFECLRGVVGDGRLRDGGVWREEARNRSVENVAVEIVGGQLPLDQETVETVSLRNVKINSDFVLSESSLTVRQENYACVNRIYC
jgi:hypothetical protein